MLCIDVHHHIFPTGVIEEKERLNLSLGWHMPEGNLPWSPELSIKTMDASGVDLAILSLPAFNTDVVSNENRSHAREKNNFMWTIRRSYPQRFGFFACLPFLDDIEGAAALAFCFTPCQPSPANQAALAEIVYAFDELRADGISMSSCYGEGAEASYVGEDKYEPIWAELDRRSAVVFLHGAQVPSSTPYPHPFLGVPITEVPNETFKGAAHLVVTGRKRKYPNVKIILAHLGGNTPGLAPRVAVLSKHMGCPLSEEEILEDFRSFYYETALSASGPNMLAVENFAGSERILFGTDFPAVSTEMAAWFTRNLEEHFADNPEKLRGIMSGNAIKLFPKLALQT